MPQANDGPPRATSELPTEAVARLRARIQPAQATILAEFQATLDELVNLDCSDPINDAAQIARDLMAEAKRSGVKFLFSHPTKGTVPINLRMNRKLMELVRDGGGYVASSRYFPALTAFRKGEVPTETEA